MLKKERRTSLLLLELAEANNRRINALSYFSASSLHAACKIRKLGSRKEQTHTQKLSLHHLHQKVSTSAKRIVLLLLSLLLLLLFYKYYYYFFLISKRDIYKKGKEASRHTGSIRGYHPLKQKTTRPKPYLEANHSKKPIRDFDSISMYTLAQPQIMYRNEVFIHNIQTNCL